MATPHAVLDAPHLPVVDVELLARLAHAGGQSDEPLRLLARLVNDADASGHVSDFSLSGYARKLGYGPSGRRTLSGYLRPLIAAGAVAYLPARGPAPGYCQLHLVPPAGTRALTRAPETRRAGFCAPDQHFSGPLKGCKEGKGTPPLTPPQPRGDLGAAAGLGRGDDKTGKPPAEALVDALVAALPVEARNQPRLAKDAGGWHALAATASELAELIDVDAMVAAVTADPPAGLRSPVGWLLARTRNHLAQTQVAGGGTDQTKSPRAARSHARPVAPSTGPHPLANARPATRRVSGPNNAVSDVTPTEPIPPDVDVPPPACGDPSEVADPCARRGPSLSPVPKTERVSDALAAVAALTVAGPWREQLAAAARGELLPTTSTVRSLAQAMAEALAATPQLTGRALVATLTNRSMPADVKDLPGLLAARARALTATKPRGATNTSSPAPPQSDRGCATCDGSLMALDEDGAARPCPTCRPHAKLNASPQRGARQPGAGGGFARIGDLLPHLSALTPHPGGTNQCNPTASSSAP